MLRTTAEVRALSEKDMRANLPVEITGQIIAAPYSGGLILRDSSGGFILQGVPKPAPALGDIVTVHGHTHIDNRNRQGAVQVEKVAVHERRNPPEARPTDARRVSSGMDNFDLVRLHGFVAEIFKDQNHSDWNYIIVRDDGIPIYVAVPNVGETTVPFHNLIDAEVEIVGIGLPHYGADRMFVGPHIETWSKRCIKVVHPALEDPFSSPRLGDIIHVGPSELAKMRRHLVEGDILAVWGGNRFLMREDTRRLLTVGLADGQSLPQPGERVQAVGFPTTDLFRLNLSRALWKSVSNHPAPKADSPQTVTPSEIFADCRGRHTNIQGDRLLRQTFHGQLIRIRGIVRSLPSYINGNGQMNIECDGSLVPIDSSANPTATDDISIGCEIEATGICVMETEKWSPTNLFPVFGGFTLVIRSPDDIRVLSRPSWWTPTRLLVVIASLFAALIAFFVWNRILNRIVERRSRQLFKEQVAHAGTTLKIGERTRLAVELHDSLSQNLAGLACQISATKSAVAVNPEKATKCLNIAEQMLLSSRTELRRCLWDLRSDTLEINDMTEAVLKTVKPVVSSAELIVLFNVPRSRLMDSTTHSILCIIRELASNAVRHGHATQIRVSGEFRGDTLSFSVHDNGCGFDVHNHLGLAEGHFGLTGIRERVERLDGTFTLESDPSGTRTRITLTVPHAAEKETDNT